jgi:hypothetical protein
LGNPPVTHLDKKTKKSLYLEIFIESRLEVFAGKVPAIFTNKIPETMHPDFGFEVCIVAIYCSI